MKVGSVAPWLVVLLGTPVVAQTKPAPAPARRAAAGEVTLARVKARFEMCDADKNSQLSFLEAAQAGLGPRDLPGDDLDKDQQLSVDEYVLAFHKVLAARGTTCAADFDAEVVKIQTAIEAKKVADKAKPKPAVPSPQPPAANPPAKQDGGATPAKQDAAPAPKRDGAAAAAPASSDPKTDLEKKIDQALREASDGKKDDAEPKPAAPTAERPRKAPKDSPDAGGGDTAAGAGQHDGGAIDKKAADAEQKLTKRLRNAEVDPATATEEREKLRQRVANAKGESAPATESTPAPAAGNASGAASTANHAAALEAKAKAQEEALVTRMRNAGKSDAEIETAKGELRARLKAALEADSAASSATASPSAPDSAPSSTPSSTSSSTPASSAPAAAPAGTAKAPGSPNAAALEAQAKQQEDALVTRMRNAGKSEAEIEAARTKLRARLTNAIKNGGALTDEASATGATATPAANPPAEPAADPADRAKAAQGSLEKRLKNANASDEQSQEARDKLQKRIDNANKATDAKGADAKGSEAKGTDTKGADKPPAPQEKPPAPAANGNGGGRAQRGAIAQERNAARPTPAANGANPRAANARANAANGDHPKRRAAGAHGKRGAAGGGRGAGAGPARARGAQTPPRRDAPPSDGKPAAKRAPVQPETKPAPANTPPPAPGGDAKARKPQQPAPQPAPQTPNGRAAAPKTPATSPATTGAPKGPTTGATTGAPADEHARGKGKNGKKHRAKTDEDSSDAATRGKTPAGG